MRAFSLSGEGTAAHFVRTEGGWRMTAPVADAVEAAAVEKILQAAKRSRVIRTIEDPEPLASYGLDPPRGSLRVETERTVPRLDLGAEDPTRQGVFALVEGRPGVLVLAYPDAIVFREIDPIKWRKVAIKPL